ncbi:MAG: hypothetical protein K0Q93_3186 [Nocardioidaceae bacterium]|nr:hypothetical protein [Nocardioidaceae bacterium]
MRPSGSRIGRSLEGLAAWTIRRGKVVRPRDAAVVAECQHGRMLMYALHDYDPERDGDEEAWAARLERRSGGCGARPRLVDHAR